MTPAGCWLIVPIFPAVSLCSALEKGLQPVHPTALGAASVALALLGQAGITMLEKPEVCLGRLSPRKEIMMKTNYFHLWGKKKRLL